MYDLIIIGAGAAGLFLAANLKGKNVLLLEKMKVPGKKILISGGGMCNLTNCDSIDDFLNYFGSSKKANFLKPALLNLSSSQTRKWFESSGLPLVVREDGKVFPRSLKAKSVVDCLCRKARDNNVTIKISQEVCSIQKENDAYIIKTTKEEYKSSNVVLTTGGKSFETTGSDGSGYLLAKALGHKIISPTQALVAVNVEQYSLARLAGNSIRQSSVDFYRDGESKRYLQARGDLLFTHKGISGSVILNNSREIHKDDLIKASLIQADNKEESRGELHKAFIKDSKKQVSSILKSLGIVSNLIEILLEASGIDKDCKCATLNKKSRNKLITLLLEFPFKVSRKGYFSSAMVTAGGVDLNEVNRKTMESKKSAGLYFAGEVLDIDGNTGGYNIQAAFSTAYLISLALQ